MKKFVGVVLAAMFMGIWAGCGASGPVQKISYITFDSSNNTQVYTLTPDGKTSTQLTITVPQDAFFVTASPNANEVVYCKYVDQQTGQAAIFMMDMKGTEKQLTSGANWGDCIPSFSRDGHFIAFESYRDDPNFVQMYVMNADGTGQKRILTDSADNFFPQISPDNKTIAFFRYNSGTATGTKPALSSQQRWGGSHNPWSAAATHGIRAAIRPQVISTGDGLYTVNIDGSNPKQVFAVTNAYSSSPAFSADGKKIVFSTQQFDTTNGSDFEIGSVNIDGSGLKNLSNNAATWDFAPLVIGNTIYFNRENSDGYTDIYQMNMDGTGQKNLTNTPAADEFLPGYYDFAG